MYRKDSKECSANEKAAIAEFEKSFRPEWNFPADQFSDWHYMVLSQVGSVGYHYDKPVVVLMNAKCFSATDIFLAGLKGRENLTLMGTASGGGSAFKRTVDLGKTPLELQIARMASFQADGLLFDGNGFNRTEQ
ncbi:S41 family peptidase [Novipirellula rosea]|uniref:Tail specific protease domain-containing protein n=1 Tax=Novipirellula rosea TaxID=1031540 RepID=A0ABP8MMQ8_9BACT